MWCDADIDALMARTAGRAIPCGRILRGEALAFGLVLAGSSVAILALALAFTIFFYVVLYMVGGRADGEDRYWRGGYRNSVYRWQPLSRACGGATGSSRGQCGSIMRQRSD